MQRERKIDRDRKRVCEREGVEKNKKRQKSSV